MASPLLPDDVWERIKHSFPPAKPRRHIYPGRLPIPDRKALTGILFVLKSGISWNELPQELGCGSGSRCRRRLAEWYCNGVWQKIAPVLMNTLTGAVQWEWTRAVLDGSARFRAGRKKRAKTPGSDSST